MPGPEDQPKIPEAFGPDPRRIKALKKALHRSDLELQDRLGRLDEKIHKSEDEVKEADEAARLRFLRARRLLEWLTVGWAHFMEPPAVELYFDGSGKFLLGPNTFEALEKEDKRETFEAIVGSSRWEVERRRCDETVSRYALKFCHLRTDNEVPPNEGGKR